MDNCCIMLIFCRLLGHIIFNYILKFETILLNIHNSISINRSKHKTFEQFWPLLYIHDSNLTRIAEQLIDGSKSNSKSARKALAKYHMIEGVLYKRGRRCISRRKDKETVLKEFHDSLLNIHPGIEKTYAALSELFYWPNMYSDTVE